MVCITSTFAPRAAQLRKDKLSLLIEAYMMTATYKLSVWVCVTVTKRLKILERKFLLNYADYICALLQLPHTQ